MRLFLRNRTLAICFALATLTMLALNSQAQKLDKKFSFGFGIEAGLPLGDFKEAYSLGSGLTIRASYKVGPGFATLTTGAVGYLPKKLDVENLKVGVQIPVKAGYKFIYNGLFAMAEVGFSQFNYYYTDMDDALSSIKYSGPTFAPTVGYQTGVFEIGLRYEITRFSGGNMNAAMLRLGFNF